MKVSQLRMLLERMQHKYGDYPVKFMENNITYQIDAALFMKSDDKRNDWRNDLIALGDELEFCTDANVEEP